MNVNCVKCGSERVIPQATVWDPGQSSSGTLQAYVYAKPGAILFKGPVFAKLYARICADCGHAELYAEDADKLYDAYRQAQSRAAGG